MAIEHRQGRSRHGRRSGAAHGPSPFDVGLFYLACLLLAFFGGTSRADLVQVPVLQISLWLIVAVAVIRLPRVAFGKGLLLCICAYGLWLALQVVPLPHGIWTSLPGRAPIEQAEIALGQHFPRPFSMDPSRTLSALGNLGAVLAPLLAAQALRHEAPRHILQAVIGIGALSSALVVTQMLAGTPYLYAITNDGQPVGLFANANHFAVFASVIVVVLAFLSGSGSMQQRVFVAGLAFFVLVTALITQSRAGFMAGMLAFLASGVLVLDRRLNRSFLTEMPAGTKLLALVVVVGVVLAGLMLAYLGALPAVDRLFAEDTFADLRFAILPTLVEMAGIFTPFGSGVGSFEEVYRTFELREMLHPNYVNMAHNDIIQFYIEGGVLAVGFLVAFGYLGFSYLRGAGAAVDVPWRLWFCAGSIALICVMGSAFDYPLRSPIFQSTIVLLVALLASLSRSASDTGQTNA